VRYQVSGKVDNLCYCHCQSCRRAAGAPMVPWGTFANDRFQITKGGLKEYRSSAQVLRGFCANCGTSMTYRHEKRPAEIDVILVTLDDPTVLVPQAHIWLRDKLPWVDINDGKPTFQQYRPKNS
jgi:hypothetical protein